MKPFSRITVCLVMIFFFLLAQNGFAQQLKKPFVIYQTLGYKGMPDLQKKYGIEYMKIYGDAHFYSNKPSAKIPETAVIKKWAISSQTLKDKVVTLDIEHWPLIGVSEIEFNQNLGKYISVVTQFSTYAPDVKIGYYSTLPIRNYRDPVRASKNISNQLEKWQEKNKNLLLLATNVNVIMPSLYTFDTNKNDWVEYAKSTIAEAKQYNKPIYVYLWPEYHQSSKWGWGHYIDEEFFYLQLMTIYKYADGIILWSPKSEKLVKQWQATDGWWKALDRFLKDINYTDSKPSAPAIIKAT